MSLIGTFAVMAALGFSINMLTLFGLVLAVGIVVDDAIVVVENVERKLREGLSPPRRRASTMDEVGAALIAIALVLTAVFIPTAFIGGITGKFYRQFAVTVAIGDHHIGLQLADLEPGAVRHAAASRTREHASRQPADAAGARASSRLFNCAVRQARRAATAGRAARVIARRPVMLVVYARAARRRRLAGCCIRRPASSRRWTAAYVIVSLQLPQGASLQRTDEVVRRANKLVLETPGVAHTRPTRAARARPVPTRATSG